MAPLHLCAPTISPEAPDVLQDRLRGTAVLLEGEVSAVLLEGRCQQSCWRGGVVKSFVFKLHLHVVTVCVLELDVCLGTGEDHALPGTVPDTKEVEQTLS